MQSELRQLHRQLGITVLFVTHDQEEAMILADRIAVLARGRLQQVGRADELYEAPANELVAGFVGESNLLRGTVVSAAGGMLRVVTAGGTEFGVAGEASPGRAVTLLIRPESLRLVTDQLHGSHGLQGVVEEVVYLGGLRKYTIRLNPSEILVVRLPTRLATRQLTAGTQVRLEWEPPDLRVL